ncbi:hypothetical protein [Spirosoma endophyticum]|uniref:Uncharacterized protein n=1 Tax=Spirosoma endophyticum TaxID=662367 RepID=A0A1I2ERY1_9BACT|nr:hypothetical protein [Spirosoma endophyticum]SFE95822.1 hypothetical protein SAMN05216167_12329 [Spirosoma endophyticum]
MSCRPSASEPTPIERLPAAADAFSGLSLDAGKQVVTNAYLKSKYALFDAMTLDIDPKRYDVSWSIIKSFADKEIGDFQELSLETESNSMAFTHLQHLVIESHKYVPWG